MHPICTTFQKELQIAQKEVTNKLLFSLVYEDSLLEQGMQLQKRYAELSLKFCLIDEITIENTIEVFTVLKVASQVRRFALMDALNCNRPLVDLTLDYVGESRFDIKVKEVQTEWSQRVVKLKSLKKKFHLDHPFGHWPTFEIHNPDASRLREERGSFTIELQSLRKKCFRRLAIKYLEDAALQKRVESLASALKDKVNVIGE